jgi:hypothetical protein
MNETVKHSGESIIDVAIREYGHIHGLYNLIKDNALSFSSDVLPGSVLMVDEDADFSELPEVEIKVIKSAAPNYITVEPNQNIYDLAIQETGDISGIVDLVKSNNISFSSQVIGGEKFIKPGVISKVLVNYLKYNKPATGSEVLVNNTPVKEGIGYWNIEVDFIVS